MVGFKGVGDDRQPAYAEWVEEDGPIQAALGTGGWWGCWTNGRYGRRPATELGVISELGRREAGRGMQLFGGGRGGHVHAVDMCERARALRKQTLPVKPVQAFPRMRLQRNTLFFFPMLINSGGEV